MFFYQGITKEIATAFGSSVLESAPSLHKSRKALSARNLPIKDRALREKTREHSQVFALGRLMIILPDKLKAILLAETEVEHAQSKAGY